MFEGTEEGTTTPNSDAEDHGHEMPIQDRDAGGRGKGPMTTQDDNEGAGRGKGPMSPEDGVGSNGSEGSS